MPENRKPLIDTHAHLDSVADIPSAIARARSKGIVGIVAVGMDRKSNRTSLALAKAYPDIVLPAIGYHPWNILQEETEANLAYIQTHLKACIALGEVGLDYKVKVRKQLQRQVFSDLLVLARQMRKPVIVHCRFSHHRALQMLISSGIERAVFHWYSGSLDILDKILTNGYYVSATPALAYSRAHRQAIKEAPLERIMIETDSPVSYQGSVSEPSHLLHTLRALSQIKDKPVAELAEATTQTSRNFLGLP